MTYGSTFTGIGGFDSGFDQAGLECLWQIERDKDCNRVLRKHWPETKRGTLIEDCSPERFARPDVICGGFPCQDLSVAGRRKGLAGERSGLWHEFRRVIAEFKPGICVVENVPGIFSSNGGRDFLTVIRGLAELGYCVGWTVLDSQYQGVAQRRERVFIVGSLGNGSCAEVLFEPESVRGDSAPRRETREGTTYSLSPSLSASGRGTERAGESRGQDCVIPTLARSLNAERDGYNDGSDQTYVPEVAWALQEPDAKGADSDTKDGHLIPVAFQRRIGRNGRGQPETIAPALSGADAGATSDMRPCVAYTIQNNDGGAHKRKDRPNGGLYVKETDKYLTVGSTDMTAIATQFSVRRLTPRECERLQGFPDDWTRWDADGKEISDSARYRMLGNAVTVPVARWLGERIQNSAGSSNGSE